MRRRVYCYVVSLAHWTFNVKVIIGLLATFFVLFVGMRKGDETVLFDIYYELFSIFTHPFNRNMFECRRIGSIF